ncbi:hypothetical protein LCM4579_28155 [Ensifer sp. LCM 4579]|nr:hypothetical protein LCM4579_28155 [Ensifer sp. LCM 4579]
MVSLLFAGMKNSSSNTRSLMPRLLTQRHRQIEITVRFLTGTASDFTSESAHFQCFRFFLVKRLASTHELDAQTLFLTELTIRQGRIK